MTQKNNECIVVIPTHKGTMSPEEERSFKNTLNVLQNWDIALVLPLGISPNYYEEIREKEKLQFEIITLGPNWMGSIERYNDMALSSKFYQLFEAYKYILICHLDAWVFRDELQMWIDKGYHYIGAPWFLPKEKVHTPLESIMCPQGGNGGFSLRKIDKMIELTSNLKHSLNSSLFFRGVLYLLKNKRFDLLKIFVKACWGVLRDADSYQKKFNIYEDAMFSVFYSLLDKTFSVAPAREAMYFATEVHSEEILKTKLKWQLPFAIHGYDKYFPSITAFDDYRNDEARNEYTKNIYRNKGTKQNGIDDKPLVTVVTATHNLIKAGRVETFKQCMESVYKQTYTNIEHIIIDGASSDGTLDLIQEYVDKGWCVCYSEKDDGVWDAMYRGHQRAKGEYVNYLNTDDYFCQSDAIEIAVKSLIRKNADWFFSDGFIIRKDGTSYSFPTSLYGVFSCMGILHQTMFVRTSILRGINPFHSNHITRENFLMMLLCINNIKYAYSNESLVCYREGGFSTEEYGNSNLSRTKSDFSKYFYNNIGCYWGMSEEECLSMFGWECFSLNGVRYSYRLSKKLRTSGLRFAFRTRLAQYAYRHKNFREILSREIRDFIKTHFHN